MIIIKPRLKVITSDQSQQKDGITQSNSKSNEEFVLSSPSQARENAQLNAKRGKIRVTQVTIVSFAPDWLKNGRFAIIS